MPLGAITPNEALEDAANYVPLAAYFLLLAISGWRLWVHRVPLRVLSWGKRGLSVGSASKFWFHLFLFTFALMKVAETALSIPKTHAVVAPELVFNLVSGCSYITLLLFLEMHWREILKPLTAMRSKRATWAWFWASNALLYVVVFTAAVTEWNYTDSFASLYWSSACVDIILVLIALSYTYTAVSLYLRITRSIASAKEGGRVDGINSSSSSDAGAAAALGYQALDSDAEVATPSPAASASARGQERAAVVSSGGGKQRTPSMSSPLLKHNAHLRAGGGGSSSTPAAGAATPSLPVGATGLTTLGRMPSVRPDHPLSRHGHDSGDDSAQKGPSEAALSRSSPGDHHHLSIAIPAAAAFSADGAADAELQQKRPPAPPLHDPHKVHALVDSIRTAAGLEAFRKSMKAVMSRSLYTEESRRELRGALTVFISVMLSSAALISIRASLSLAYSGSAESLWWFQLCVTWLPDVPPCLAYLLLMWPRDELEGYSLAAGASSGSSGGGASANATSGKSTLGVLFTSLVDSEAALGAGAGDANRALLLAGDEEDDRRTEAGDVTATLLPGSALGGWKATATGWFLPLHKKRAIVDGGAASDGAGLYVPPLLPGSSSDVRVSTIRERDPGEAPSSLLRESSNRSVTAGARSLLQALAHPFSASSAATAPPAPTAADEGALGAVRRLSVRASGTTAPTADAAPTSAALSKRSPVSGGGPKQLARGTSAISSVLGGGGSATSLDQLLEGPGSGDVDAASPVLGADRPGSASAKGGAADAAVTLPAGTSVRGTHGGIELSAAAPGSGAALVLPLSPLRITGPSPRLRPTVALVSDGGGATGQLLPPSPMSSRTMGRPAALLPPMALAEPSVALVVPPWSVPTVETHRLPPFSLRTPVTVLSFSVDRVCIPPLHTIIEDQIGALVARALDAQRRRRSVFGGFATEAPAQGRTLLYGRSPGRRKALLARKPRARTASGAAVGEGTALLDAVDGGDDSGDSNASLDSGGEGAAAAAGGIGSKGALEAAAMPAVQPFRPSGRAGGPQRSSMKGARAGGKRAGGAAEASEGVILNIRHGRSAAPAAAGNAVAAAAAAFAARNPAAPLSPSAGPSSPSRLASGAHQVMRAVVRFKRHAHASSRGGRGGGGSNAMWERHGRARAAVVPLLADRLVKNSPVSAAMGMGGGAGAGRLGASPRLAPRAGGGADAAAGIGGRADRAESLAAAVGITLASSLPSDAALGMMSRPQLQRQRSMPPAARRSQGGTRPTPSPLTRGTSAAGVGSNAAPPAFTLGTSALQPLAADSGSPLGGSGGGRSGLKRRASLASTADARAFFSPEHQELLTMRPTMQRGASQAVGTVSDGSASESDEGAGTARDDADDDDDADALIGAADAAVTAAGAPATGRSDRPSEAPRTAPAPSARRYTAAPVDSGSAVKRFRMVRGGYAHPSAAPATASRAMVSPAPGLFSDAALAPEKTARSSARGSAKASTAATAPAVSEAALRRAAIATMLSPQWSPVPVKRDWREMLEWECYLVVFVGVAWSEECGERAWQPPSNLSDASSDAGSSSASDTAGSATEGVDNGLGASERAASATSPTAQAATGAVSAGRPQMSRPSAPPVTALITDTSRRSAAQSSSSGLPRSRSFDAAAQLPVAPFVRRKQAALANEGVAARAAKAAAPTFSISTPAPDGTTPAASPRPAASPLPRMGRKNLSPGDAASIASTAGSAVPPWAGGSRPAWR